MDELELIEEIMADLEEELVAEAAEIGEEPSWTV